MMTIKRVLSVAAAVVLISVSAAPSSEAATIALQSFSGGSNATTGPDQLYGWRFSVLSSIDVTALGVGDTDDDGLALSHDVGIFRISDQTLLASATVPAGVGSSLLAGFRYVPIGSVTLAPAGYVIVMTMPKSKIDVQSINNTTVGTAPEIAYLGSATDSSSVLAFPNPTLNGAFDEGMFGPNFQFNGAAVPEPGSLVLALSGLAMIGWGRSRRQR